MNNKTLNNILSFLAIIVIGVITIYILSKISSNAQPVSKNDLIQEVQYQVEQQQSKPSLYPDFDLTRSFHSIQVATNTPSFAEKGVVEGRIKKTLYSKGHFQRMYIYIQASVDYGKPLSVYDDIYLTFNYAGGHVSPADSLDTPASEISNLLYSAQSFPYTQGSKQTNYLNVMAIFNQNPDVGINIFLSTARKGGKVNDFTIYYECDEGIECLISDKK